ncbi:MAG: U32 family peptidase [Anaerolineae bacterium]|nr:U32 family peptidase [Anaerolineae bacterium]
MPTGSVSTELLAPAKDLECGLAAVDCGADAVYIGAARFGARSKVGNSLADIEELAAYAHTFWARVYVTVNTLLYDQELPQAVRLIHQLYEAGVDGVIVQDVGLLECDLPPIPLIASTQMHNATPAKVAFLEAVGFHRAILARELSLAQIRAIRQAAPSIELESFVHGALCVSYSGQCFMSYAAGGRSGNRGECAQPCRRRYMLVDREGTPVRLPGAEGYAERYWLSLRDLNLSADLDALLDAGVTSFKIEGRLKDVAYIKNVVSFYRQQLDVALAARGWGRSSSGRSAADFAPDVDKTFNRGYTTHFLHGRAEPPGSIATPKMVGEFVGVAIAARGKTLTLDRDADLHNGDGLAFFDEAGELQGAALNGVDGRQLTLSAPVGVRKGTSLYRNHDHAYLTQLVRADVTRAIVMRLTLDETPTGFSLAAEDEDGNRAVATLDTEKVPAQKPEMAQATALKQLQKTGDTAFACSDVGLRWSLPYFLPVAAFNDLRRRALALLSETRAAHRPVRTGVIHKNHAPYPETRLNFEGNALNAAAVAFYRRHGVLEIEPAAESGLDMRGKPVMHTKYCLKHQLGLCDGTRQASGLKEPLSLVDEDGRRYQLRFECAICEMEVIYEP